MLDKIRLQGTVKAHSKLISKLCPKNHKEIETLQEHGIYDGASLLRDSCPRFYDNDEIYNLTCSKSSDDLLVKLEFNPNKICGYIPGNKRIDYTDVKTAIEAVQTQLYSKGININPNELNLYAHHVNYDLPLNDKYEKYYPYINAIPSMTRKTSKREIVDTLYFEQMKNKNEKIVVYDKTKEWNKEHKPALTENIMRIEHRIEKIEKINRYKLKDLTETHFRLALYEAKDAITKYILPEPSNIQIQNFEKIAMLRHLFYDMALTSAQVKKHIARLWFGELTEIDISKALGVKRHDKSYQKINRFIQDMYKLSPINPENIDVYFELRETFLKVAS